MNIAKELVRIASDLEKRGLRKLADDLDAILDEILNSEQHALTTNEPEAPGGSGPLMPAELAAFDGMPPEMAAYDGAMAADTNTMPDEGMDLGQPDELGMEAPAAPAVVALTPEQEKNKMVVRLYRKVMKHCESQNLFADIPRLLKEVKLKKETESGVHGIFKLQAKRLIQCGIEFMNKLCDKYHIDLTTHEKLDLVRKMGFEILDRSGSGQLKYDFVAAMAEYKHEGHAA